MSDKPGQDHSDLKHVEHKKTHQLQKTLAEHSVKLSGLAETLKNSKEALLHANAAYEQNHDQASYSAYIFAAMNFYRDAVILGTELEFCLSFVDRIHAQNTKDDKKADAGELVRRATDLTPHVEYITKELGLLDECTNTFKPLKPSFSIEGQTNSQQVPVKKALSEVLAGIKQEYEDNYKKHHPNKVGLFFNKLFQNTKARSAETNFLLAVNVAEGATDRMRLAAIQLVIDGIEEEKHADGSTFKALLEGYAQDYRTIGATGRGDFKAFLSEKGIEAPQNEKIILEARF